MHIAICDDEDMIAADIEQRISRLLAEREIPYAISTMTSPETLLSGAPSVYDMIFLDVDMVEWNGIDVALQIRQYDMRVLVIFISGHIEYSPHGYKVNAFRYLLKSELDETLEECVDDAIGVFRSTPEILVVKQHSENISLILNEILYAESQRAVLLYHMVGDNSVIKAYETMHSLEHRLKPKGFLRIQKSYIVNLLHVKQIRNYQVILDNGECLQASRTYFREVQRAFMLWKGRI